MIRTKPADKLLRLYRRLWHPQRDEWLAMTLGISRVNPTTNLQLLPLLRVFFEVRETVDDRLYAVHGEDCDD